MSHKPTVAVVFGSRSVEHEVSVVSALQVINAIDRSRYDVIPLYINKAGQWLTGKELEKVESFKKLSIGKNVSSTLVHPSAEPKSFSTPMLIGYKPLHIDVIFPVIHGTNGEDGTLQGMLELADVPYVGCAVTASAVGMDKVIQKAVFAQNGLNVVKHVWFFREEFIANQEFVLKNIEKLLPYPVVIKPANLGSSVGISLAHNRQELVDAIELTQSFDRKILIEEALTDMIEINCSVLGWKTLQTSVCEQPLKKGEFLSYKDKYMSGGKTGKSGAKSASSQNNTGAKGMASLDRLIPAPIPEVLAQKIQAMTKTAFRSIDGSGIARIDYMVTTSNGKVTPKSKVYINEINTMPGSLAFYLWEASGVSFQTLCTTLIELALERKQDQKKTMFSIDSGLLEMVGGGTKSR